MVKFEGKYELEKNENYVEFIISTGQQIPDEVAKKIREDKAILIVEVEGEKQYKLSNKNSIRDHVLSFTIGKPFVEKIEGQEVNLENFAKQEGDKITITSAFNGKATERIYEFSEKGLVLTLQSPESKIVAKQYFKRV